MPSGSLGVRGEELGEGCSGLRPPTEAVRIEGQGNILVSRGSIVDPSPWSCPDMGCARAHTHTQINESSLGGVA